ncbi:autotransporter assembly complex protein TamA [Labrys monachus]|uniref:Translocation and assembly module TamA n=1 Tax=Labrys monachus TaxID=217067 RepID=A0ABU0FIB3_9HYPH|nr:autotransporter assembly complex family protein [Labrys monachus]MDQ0394251.1 translocation and assembly module TamA [Labrys monachus]
MKSLALSVAGTALLAGVAPQPAAAFKLFGYTFFEGDKKPASPDAQPYKIDINVADGNSGLKDVIQNASLLYSGKDDTPPPSTPAFLSRARAEYERILAALYAGGRYGGTISILVNGQPVEQIRNDVTLPHPVPVVINVDPGPLFTFGAIVMKGRAPPSPADDNPKTRTPENLGLIAGRPANSEVVLQSEQALVDAWRRLGYPKARALPRAIVADHVNHRLNVTIGVDPGRPARYGAVAVTGTRDMNPDFVARQTGLVPGEPYDPAEIELAKRRLQHLQVFSSTSIVEGDAIAPDGTLPMTVAVAESPLHVFGAGASYSTTDGAGVNGYWEHRNLFGEAERLRFDAAVSGVGSSNSRNFAYSGGNSSDPRDFTYLGGVTFVKPGILDPFTDLTAQLLFKREVYDPYAQNTFRARVGLTHEFSQQLTGKIAVNGEYDEVADGFGRRDLLFFSLPAELAYDTTDDKLEPTQGYRIKGTFEPFYEAKFGNFGAVSRLDGSAYFSFDQAGRYVLAGRAAVGSLVGAPADEMPADRLFFAGGGGSVRGFDYRSLGPKLDNGVIVGGRSLVEGSLEMRVRVTDTIGVVPFVDAGSAFDSAYPNFSENIKIGAGLGLRYYTGLGAIRVDIARALTRERGQPPFALYIGLGESF